MVSRKQPKDPESRTTERTTKTTETYPNQTDEGPDPLEKVLSQFGSAPGVRIRVAKQQAGGQMHCLTIDGTDVDLDYIAAHHGGGKYFFRVYLNGEYKQVIEQLIAEPANDNGKPRKENPDATPAAQSAEVSALNTLSDLLRTQLERGVQTPATAPAPEPLSKLGEMMTGLLTAMSKIANSNNPQPKQNGGDMDSFMKGVDFGRRYGSKGDDTPTDWKQDAIAAIRDGLPTIAGILAQRTPTATAPTEQPANPEDPEVKTVLIRQGLAYLKAKALAGADPGLLVDMALLNAEDPTIGSLVRTAVTSEFETLVGVDPEILASPVLSRWFRELYDGLRSAVSGADPVDGDIPGSAGDPSDAGADAETGADGGPGPSAA